uniref:Uncharacterized protein n=1 Tax=Rhizophora mucronata TaxID=61149 RepID=A0A2P2NWH7_RHIMU
MDLNCLKVYALSLFRLLDGEINTNTLYTEAFQYLAMPRPDSLDGKQTDS